MNKLMLASVMAFAASTSSAFAAPVVTFDGGAGSALPSGTTVIEDFEGFGAGSSIGTNAFAYGSSNSNGARPAFNSTGNFASVSTGGLYSASFAPTSMFSFVLGSLDTYNSLTLRFDDLTSQLYSGGQIIGATNFPSGDQSSGRTNGVVSYSVGSGPRIVGADFGASNVAFEFDNISVASAVPEPATWGMMLLGFGAVGSMARRRRNTQVAFAV